MKRLIPILALTAIALARLPASDTHDRVPEPGHYEGGQVSFRLTQDGEIHNLHIHGRLAAHVAGRVHGRHFHFNHRAAIFRYEGDGWWETATHCEGDYLQYVPSVPSAPPAHYKWRAHRVE